jgi:hypothetical protein
LVKNNQGKGRKGVDGKSDALILAAYFFIGMWRVTGDKQVDDQATFRHSDCEILRLYVIVRAEHAYSYRTIDEKREVLYTVTLTPITRHDTIQYDTMFDLWR